MHIKLLVLATLLGGTMGTMSGSPFGAQESGGQVQSKVRPAVCAGTWYPGSAAELSELIDGLLARASPPQVEGKPVALVCPHAGYRYSAAVAAAAYATLRGHSYQRVIVLAFSHRYAGRYRGIDVPRDLAAYQTPLGQVPLDREACDRLLKNPLFVSKPEAGADEHSLELQLPFLQRVLGDFRLVPLLVGQMSERDYTVAAEALLPLVGDQTLLVVSTDFTHYGPGYGYVPFRDDIPRKLQELADQAAKVLTRCDYDGFVAHLDKTGDTVCGRNPLCLLLRLIAMKGGAAGIRAAYDTSGRMTGDWVNSVTYQSFVYVPRKGRLSAAERTELLRIARQTVTAYLKGQKPPPVDAQSLPPVLRENGACFVTLQNRGELRGCIGNMIAEGPLYQAVIRNAISACRDPRFVNNPVTERELDELHIEISYLSPMRKVESIDEIVIGQHGLLISLGPARGVLLPQVAYERGWTRQEFLRQVCLKAALPPEAWKDPEAELYCFEAEVFGEPQEKD